MTPELWIALMNFAVKFSIDAALAIAKRMNQPAATIDDAILALTEASEKTYETFIQEAKDRAAKLAAELPAAASVVPDIPFVSPS